MMNSNRTMTLTVIAAVAAVAAIVSYAAYFDHKRRHDTAFRKELRRQQKKAHRSATKEAKTTVTSIPREDLLKALQELKKETLPTSAQEKEAYFSQNIGMAEQLCMQGDTFHLPAALSFYRALRVYPDPMELILLFQRMVPEPILKLVMELWSHDVSETSPTASVVGRAASAAGTSPTSTARTGPPSETSSQEWDNLTDSGVHH